MEPSAAQPGLDGAMVALILFAAFFFWLVFFHLRPHDKREGYPTIRPDGSAPFRRGRGLTWMPFTKTFLRPHGQPPVTTPRAEPRAGDRPTVMPENNGQPLRPQEDGLLEGVGPAAWAQREDVPDYNIEGKPKLVSLEREAEYRILEGCPDPRGWPVYGSDGEHAGTVRDIWFNRAEFFPRYLEVAGVTRDYLVPLFFAVVHSGDEAVRVRDLPGARLALAPFRHHEDRITLLEEDRINAFFAGARFYGTSPKGELAR